MSSLDLTYNSAFVRQVTEGCWFDLPGGRKVSPAHAGWKSGDGYELHVSPTPLEPVILLADAQEQKINEAWELSQHRFAESTVSVTVNGALRTYGCDPVTRENITAINTAISRAPHLVPNPRPYTPKGEAPVMTTHEEFLAIYFAGIAKGDAFYQAYYAHKVAIEALEDPAEVLAYDASTGWPE